MTKFETQDDFTTFDLIMDRLKQYNQGDKLYYVRFGDGDLIMMYPESLGQTIGRANQFEVTNELQKEMYDSWNIVDDNYMVAASLNLSSPFTTDHGNAMHDKVRSLINNNILTNRYQFYSHPTFESNFIYKPEKFIEFCKLLYGKKKLWINQLWHDNVETILGNIVHHVQTPSTNSYADIDNWYPEILKVIDDVEVIILASGFSSRVLANRLWKAGINKIVLDIGSVVDMFIANTELLDMINTRSTMQTHETEILKSLDFILNSMQNK